MLDKDITLTLDDAIKEVLKVRASLYGSISKTKARRNFKMQRPSEQAMAEVSWTMQLIALDMAVEALEVQKEVRNLRAISEEIKRSKEGA